MHKTAAATKTGERQSIANTKNKPCSKLQRFSIEEAYLASAASDRIDDNERTSSSSITKTTTAVKSSNAYYFNKRGSSSSNFDEDEEEMYQKFLKIKYTLPTATIKQNSGSGGGDEEEEKDDEDVDEKDDDLLNDHNIDRNHHHYHHHHHHQYNHQSNGAGVKPTAPAATIESTHRQSKSKITNENDDDLKLNDIDYSRNEYKQMIFHYKNLCKSYKKQLIESRKTIHELNSTVAKLEQKNWMYKKQKSSMELMQLENEDESKFIMEKLSGYCEKIAKYFVNDAMTSDEDSGCSNCRDENSLPETNTAATVSTAVAVKENNKSITTKTNKNEKSSSSSYKSKTEMMFHTLKSVLKEKHETRQFTKSFLKLTNYVNPKSELVKSSIDNLNKVDFAKLNQIANETNDYISKNSMRKYTCPCNCVNNNQQRNNSDAATMKSIEAAAAIDRNNNNEKQHDPAASTAVVQPTVSKSHAMEKLGVVNALNHHRPSTEYLISCVYMFQSLFDVDCYLNVPSRMNEIYYKYGELANFKNAIQSIFDPDETYPLEKLANAVQTVYDQLNGNLEENLKKFFNINKLNKVADRFRIYNEYFPLFNILLDEIMKTLEISRLDQIMPAIRALKILATPSPLSARESFAD